MSRLKEISHQELSDIVGDNVMQVNNDFVLNYFSITDEPHFLSYIDLKIIKNVDGSFSVYETERGRLLTRLVKIGREKYMVLPVGIARVISDDIIETFLKNGGEYHDSVYQYLGYANELSDNERIDQFLYYLSIIVVDSYGLDLYKTNVNLSSATFVLLDGVKDEFVVRESRGKAELEYERVSYIVDLFADKFNAKIHKIYQHGMKNGEFKVSVYEIINFAYNEFRANKD